MKYLVLNKTTNYVSAVEPFSLAIPVLSKKLKPPKTYDLVNKSVFVKHVYVSSLLEIKMEDLLGSIATVTSLLRPMIYNTSNDNYSLNSVPFSYHWFGFAIDVAPRRPEHIKKMVEKLKEVGKEQAPTILKAERSNPFLHVQLDWESSILEDFRTEVVAYHAKIKKILEQKLGNTKGTFNKIREVLLQHKEDLTLVEDGDTLYTFIKHPKIINHES